MVSSGALKLCLLYLNGQNTALTLTGSQVPPRAKNECTSNTGGLWLKSILQKRVARGSLIMVEHFQCWLGNEVCLHWAGLFSDHKRTTFSTFPLLVWRCRQFICFSARGDESRQSESWCDPRPFEKSSSSQVVWLGNNNCITALVKFC